MLEYIKETDPEKKKSPTKHVKHLIKTYEDGKFDCSEEKIESLNDLNQEEVEAKNELKEALREAKEEDDKEEMTKIRM